MQCGWDVLMKIVDNLDKILNEFEKNKNVFKGEKYILCDEYTEEEIEELKKGGLM